MSYQYASLARLGVVQGGVLLVTELDVAKDKELELVCSFSLLNYDMFN